MVATALAKWMYGQSAGKRQLKVGHRSRLVERVRV